jgi:AbrB family looped-hinge helix DNA binding protein
MRSSVVNRAALTKKGAAQVKKGHCSRRDAEARNDSQDVLDTGNERKAYHLGMTAVTAIINLEGQIELPREVREKLGVQAGDTVRFEVEDDGIKLYPQKATLSFRQMIGMFPLPDGQTALQYIEDLRHDEFDRAALDAAPLPPNVIVLGESTVLGEHTAKKDELGEE